MAIDLKCENCRYEFKSLDVKAYVINHWDDLGYDIMFFHCPKCEHTNITIFGKIVYEG